jgi:hypothetical protein
VLTIERFQLQSPKNLPVFIPIIEPNQVDVNKTIYKFSIGVSDGLSPPTYTYTEYTLPWIPQDKTASVPAGPVGNRQSMTNNYYYCYNYQHFLNNYQKNL